MNQIILTGRLTKEPELKTTKSGSEVCNYSIAVDRRRKDKNDEKVTDFFDCVSWGKGGAFVSTYFHKGDGITIRGRMESNKYEDKNGQKRVAWAVTVDDVEFPLGKSRGAESNGGSFSDLPGSDAELPF